MNDVTPELKPCPFCGHYPTCDSYQEEEDGGNIIHRIICSNDNCRIKPQYACVINRETYDESHWNKRVALSSIKSLEDKLKVAEEALVIVFNTIQCQCRVSAGRVDLSYCTPHQIIVDTFAKIREEK